MRLGEPVEAARIRAIHGESAGDIIDIGVSSSSPSAGSDAARGWLSAASSLMRTFGGAFFFLLVSFRRSRAVDCRSILPDRSWTQQPQRFRKPLLTVPVAFCARHLTRQ